MKKKEVSKVYVEDVIIGFAEVDKRYQVKSLSPKKKPTK
jgi:hypothetical protein